MQRFDFLGLNANESACVLLYAIVVLWVLNVFARRAYAKIVLLLLEAGAIVALGMTASRGGAVALVCGVVVVRSRSTGFQPVGLEITHTAKSSSEGAGMCAWLKQVGGLFKRMGRMPMPRIKPTGWKPVLRWPVLRWLSASPIWRVVLVFANPWMWSRSTPGYLAQDASIGNRFELWKGALKLIAADPLRGWGQPNTGAAYMNWFQGVDNHTYYRGLVNSYLQLGAAFGLPVLCGVLLVMVLAVVVAWRLLGRANRPGEPRHSNGSAGGIALPLLGFLWVLVWGVNSCFSTMLGNWLLLAPPLVAVPVLLVIRPPGKREFFWALGAAGAMCVLMFLAGWLLARGDPVAIKRDGDGMVTVMAQGAPDTSPAFSPSRAGARRSQTCVIFIDEAALGEEFGKEVRKFVLGSGFAQCAVVDKAGYSTISSENTKATDLIILSGNTVDQVEVRSGAAKYILLNPAYLPGTMPAEPVQVIVYPEINQGHYLEPEASVLDKFRSKIRKVPYNENFETSWANYLSTTD